ncbi:MAG: asparagine synthase (glutamine-hydrolyzing) [Planctomycetota bacterium]
MCGVAGLWTGGSETQSLEETVHSMTATLRHRGPDDEACWIDQQSGIALGHTRLAIIDLSPRAKQPMKGPSGNTRIAYNGEVYDYVESRRHLEGHGAQFDNDSDTLVILALYERHGLDCLGMLRGMFAFALWDRAKKRLILARDRVGKKPLYYCQEGHTLYFASEIKAILAGLHTAPTIDTTVLNEYLSYGFIGGERTIYREIRELPPGCSLLATSPNETRVSRYWQPQWLPKRHSRSAHTLDEAEALLTEAVRLRLRADVPVGVFLSGGIDSGLITALASKTTGCRLRTFSVGFDANHSFDERALARQVAQRYQTEHHEVVLSPDVASLIPKIAWHHDEPFGDASAIPSFAICSFASEHVKVVLNGDGGDELFAGYRRHLATALLARLARVLPEGIARSTARACLTVLPPSRSFRTRYALFHRFLRGLAAGSRNRLLSWHADGFTSTEQEALSRQPSEHFHRHAPVEDLADALRFLGELDRVLALDLVWTLPGALLVKMDIAAMAHGLETRSPFLDQELVAWANVLPQSTRLGGFRTKPLLRNLAKRHLPPEVVRAPKRGFEIPLLPWLQGELREMRDDLILAENGIVCSLFHRAHLERLLHEAPPDPVRWAKLTWLLLMLAAWDRYRYRRPEGGSRKHGRRKALA